MRYSDLNCLRSHSCEVKIGHYHLDVEIYKLEMTNKFKSYTVLGNILNNFM